MEKSGILHLPKSNFAYSLNRNEINLWFRAKKNDLKDVKLKYCDPFMWYDGSFACKAVQMEKKYQTELYDYYFLTLFSKTKRIKYCFILEDGKQTVKYGSKGFEDVKSSEDKEIDLFNYFNFPYINEDDLYQSPEWSKNIIWYQIFTDRFCNKNQTVKLKWNEREKVSNQDIFGGNLLGIIDKLDYLKTLGIGGIYFTPIFEAQSVHKYDTIDYFKIDPSFGTNEDFQKLVEEAHKRDIKIMLDIVFNHCGYYHPYFQDVIKNGKKSEYYDYFCYYDDNTEELFTDGKPNYHTFAFTKYMPKWNTNNPGVRKHLLDATRFWIEKYDVDGYRLDVSNEVSHSFWKDFSNTCRNLKHSFFIIGENWDNSLPWLGKDQFDAVMNYELYYPLIRFFGIDGKQIKIDGKKFTSLISEVIVSYPYNNLSSMFNLLGCHDTARIKTKCGENEELTKLAFVFLFLFTGSPNIYYGDEIGMSGENDPDNRRCMDFSKVGNNFYQFMQKLIKIRKNHLEDCKSIHIDWLSDDNNVIFFKKGNIYCILNNNEKEVSLDLKNFRGKYVDLYSESEIQLGDTLKLNNYQFYILTK